MRRLLPRTFFAQLVLSTVIVQTVLLLGFITYIVSSQRRLADQRTRERVTGQLKRLSSAVDGPLERGDLNTLQEMLELSEIAPTINTARVTDLNGKTLAVSKNGADRDLDSFEQTVLKDAVHGQITGMRQGQLEAVTPVEHDGKTVALLWLEPNPLVSINTANTVTRIALTYGGFALLANLLPIFLIVRTMTRPLRRLTWATREVMRGPESSASFPLPVTSGNEAGELTVSFNTMVQELEEQRSGLMETLALLDSMLGNAPIGLAFFDREGRHVRMNDFMAAMFGVRDGTVIGLRAAELYTGHVADGVEGAVAAVFDTGKTVRGIELTGRVPAEAEEERTWLMTFYPVCTQGSDDVRWVGAIVVDITDRLRSEETLRKTEKLAAAGRLAASVAHEINNPLEAVTNLLYLLHLHRPMDEVALDYVATAQAELSRVSDITQQTLRFYRQTASRSQTHLGEVMDSITTLYGPRLMAAHVQVFKRFRNEPELMCYGGEIRQLCANLIVNAVDAMPQGGRLLLRAQGGHGRSAAGEWVAGVTIAIADTGTGMSAETLGKIWEAFYTTKPATGTGLGLWVTEEIVRKHDGKVRVRSRQGERSGTVFRIFLPCDVAGATTEATPA